MALETTGFSARVNPPLLSCRYAVNFSLTMFKSITFPSSFASFRMEFSSKSEGSKRFKTIR